MGNVTVSRTLGHAVGRVWSVLEDFGGIHRWSAGVESSPIDPATPERGVGAVRNCHLYDGNHIEERVTESIEDEALGIDIVSTSMPLRSANARFALEATSDGGTEVTMTMDYVVKFGVVGKAMNALMLERMMTKSLTNLLAALDEHLKTGNLIEKGWQPARAA